MLTVAPLMDPADPANASNPAIELYLEQVKKYQPDVDTSNSIVLYGWSTAALLVHTLESAEKLDRLSVMEAARNLDAVSEIGGQLPGSTWTTGPDDAFVGETFTMVQYDTAAGHTKPIGELIDLNGRPRRSRRPT